MPPTAPPDPRRPRRLRANPILREALADVSLPRRSLVYPLFVTLADAPKPVASMPGVTQWPVPGALEEIRRLADRGLAQFLLFGVTPEAKKDDAGSFAASPDAPVQRLAAAVREAGLPVLLYGDLCFCEYTSHGHCGVLGADRRVDNDATLANLGVAAVAQARAGIDVVAPSGMMDGQVAAVRGALDGGGHAGVPILSYAVKYASELYGPFREAGEGGMKFGDRKGYQMDPRRSREWRTELALDLGQGADMVMVKPAVAYLDILHQVRQATDVPVAGYHVSGEYAMLHAAAERGWIDLRAAATEHTLAIRRAGADLIVSYFAPQLLDWVAA